MAFESFDSKAFCQYHCQPSHDTKRCYSLKNTIQDLIDSNALSIDAYDSSGNKSIEPPNQNLQIYTNPLPSHSTNIITQPSVNMI